MNSKTLRKKLKRARNLSGPKLSKIPTDKIVTRDNLNEKHITQEQVERGKFVLHPTKGWRKKRRDTSLGHTRTLYFLFGKYKRAE